MRDLYGYAYTATEYCCKSCLKILMLFCTCNSSVIKDIDAVCYKQSDSLKWTE